MLCLSRGQVDRLVGKSAVVQCPSCEEVVQTVTCRTVGETTWILCCLCVSGCCLIPFFSDKMKDVQHHCPRCQALISTHHPL
uniref:LITAF domain-containing protein n=1 Tax=Echeneis naucrates TaxID=173247 RepID=A0A665TIY9_ECHNA